MIAQIVFVLYVRTYTTVPSISGYNTVFIVYHTLRTVFILSRFHLYWRKWKVDVDSDQDISFSSFLLFCNVTNT
jgi:hypothetical protein